MKKQGAYIYTRVSTAIQTEGYSLEAQRQKLLDYAKYRGFAICGEYSDAGFSGKNIAGRQQFQQMLEDISNKKDDIKFVLVFKLSRFGRNAADVLSSLQFMQDYGVNLICVEDNIDSSADSGKLMISVMSAMAEIERENILVQTMAGRKQKATNGGWNGGFAPYGYTLVDGKITVVEDEARVIRDTFELYASTNKGATYVAKELNRRYTKKTRLPSDVDRFTNDFVKRIIDNPIYCGKIAYGRTINEKIEGKRNEYHRVNQKDDSKIILVDGDHEAIVSEELWEKAHQKRQDNAFRPEKVDKEHSYILAGLIRCPECGSRMYGRRNGKGKRKDGTLYDPSYSYVCRTHFAQTSTVCNKPTSISEKKIAASIRNIIVALVNDDGFKDLVEQSLNQRYDFDALQEDLESAKKEQKRLERLQQQIENQLNCIDYDDKNAQRAEESLNSRLNKVFDDLAEVEARIESINERIINAEETANMKKGIYEFLFAFEVIYDKLPDEDKRDFLRSFIDSIELYPRNTPRKSDGLKIKRINFNFPMIYKDGKEYKSIKFVDGDDSNNDSGNDNGNGNGNGGGDFSTLDDDCLHVNVGVQQLGTAHLSTGSRIQNLLRSGGQIHPQILDAVLIPAGVGDFSGVNGHGTPQILGAAAQRVLSLLRHMDTSRKRVGISAMLINQFMRLWERGSTEKGGLATSFFTSAITGIRSGKPFRYGRGCRPSLRAAPTAACGWNRGRTGFPDRCRNACGTRSRPCRPVLR